MSRKLRSQVGYSLTEMLVVVAIIGMLALVMVPNFVTFYESNKMKSSMRNFTTDVRSVRQLAITRGRQAAIVFDVGQGQRGYNWYLGDQPFNSCTWTPQTGPGRTRPTKYLDDIAYFPSTPSTAQTFTDLLDCTTSAPNCIPITAPASCPTSPAGTADTKLDVIFNPDGSVVLPAAATSGTITLKTDLNKLPKPIYTITISPTGRVLAQ
jgi:prepilin-type N-terminal cleavage/methylation domain-containing protein